MQSAACSSCYVADGCETGLHIPLIKFDGTFPFALEVPTIVQCQLPQTQMQADEVSCIHKVQGMLADGRQPLRLQLYALHSNTIVGSQLHSYTVSTASNSCDSNGSSGRRGGRACVP